MYRILYVDDESGMLEIGKLFLERSGQFSVDTITSAPAALTLLKIKTYDAIISDYQMPEVDGIEFLKQVRLSGNSIPFILFTGRGREEVVIQALNEGADFYLQKGGEPVSQFTELSHKIRQAILQKKTEIALSNSERRLSDIINFLPDATFAIDTDGIVIAWNRSIEEMTGIPAADILGKGGYEYATPFYGNRRPILIDLVFEPDEKIARYYSSISREGNSLSAETNLIHPKGNRIDALVKASPLYNRDGNVTGAIESIRDITGRKRVEEALMESEDKYRLVVENNHDAIYIFRSDQILFANSRASDLTGYPHKELMEIRLWDLVHPDDRDRLIESYRKSFSGEEVPSEYTARLLTRDGISRSCEFFVDTIMYQGAPAVLGIARDITERKKADETVREANRKLALLTTITRHDINNQVLALNGFIALLHEKVPDPALENYFTWIAQAIARISSTIQFTKAYSAVGGTDPQWQDIRTLVETAATQVPLRTVIVINDLPPGREVHADPLAVRVFYNLIENSVRYGGKITTIRFSLEECDGSCIIVCEDDGEGIPAEDKERIFEWGFGKNTGLGLALSREILGITGITIHESGSPGKGAMFEITVPPGSFRT